MRLGRLFQIVCITLILVLFQNCAPVHTYKASEQSSSSSSSEVSEEQIADIFATTLHPVLKANCSACHGASQQPMFAVADPKAAMDTIFKHELVNLEQPEESYFVKKILSGHNSFPASLAQEVQLKIKAWADALGESAPIEEEPRLSVTISSPLEGSVVDGVILISADVRPAEGVTGVQFYLNGDKLGSEIVSPPFEMELETSTLNAGNHFLSAVARNRQKQKAESSEVRIELLPPESEPEPLDMEAPVVSLVSPSNQSSVSGKVEIVATASDNRGVVGVQFYLNGTPYGFEDTTSPYSLVWDTTLFRNGSFMLSAGARDAAGNLQVSSSRTIKVENAEEEEEEPSEPMDTQAPTITLTAPANGTTVTGTVTLTADAQDNKGVVAVQFYVNGVAQGSEDLSAPYSVSWNTSGLASGNYVLTARARDAAGNTRTSGSRSVTISAPAPTNPQATYSWIYSNILQPKCLSCHSGSRASSGVRYDSYTNTLKTVRAGNPRSSDLYTETNSGSMPEDSSKLSSTQLKAIYDWISAGAAND